MLSVVIIGGALALGLSACGSSNRSKSTSSVAAAPITGTTSATTSAHTKAKLKAAKAKAKKAAAKSHATTTSSTPTTGTTTGSNTTSTTTSTPSGPTYTKPLHATLTGANHDPTVNKSWRYTVTATDANGKPLSGTVDVEFTFNGTVVGHDTPPTHPITNGRWSDTLKYPAQATGEPIALQVVVHTSIGTKTLDWPVTVKK